MRVAENTLLQKFFEDFSGKLPSHELEILLEASFHREFPERQRLNRQQIYSSESLPGVTWLTQARIWAEKRVGLGIPLQHLTGEQNFYGRYFEVGPEVLIPRPETEVLVERVLSWLTASGVSSLLGVDIGTGSGVIPITLLLERQSQLRMLTSEASPEALRRAQANARMLGVSEDRISWVFVKEIEKVIEPILEWTMRTGCMMDFLVSNPPYLRRDSCEVETEVESFEPSSALFPPIPDALFYYREISRGAHQVLKVGGMVFLEIPHERADQIRELFSAQFEDIRITSDLAGKSRVLEAKLKPWIR